MKTDIEQLKRLAEPLAAPNGADSNASWWDSFHRAANPAAVLELIAEVDRLRDEVNGMTGTLARLREQKPVRWYVRGNYFHDGDAAILFASMNAVHGAKVEQLYAAPVSAPHKGATHCDDCGLTWLDDGLNPLECPYCKQAPNSRTVRDAERYRWLRSGASAYQAQTILNDQPDAIDAAIDAARGAK